MVKRNSAVVRITLFDQHMTVEACHFGNRKDADAAKGTGLDRKHFTLCDVGTENAFAVTLQTVERNRGRRDITFECAAREIGITACGFEQSVLNQLILDGAVGTHLACGRIAAMKAHERIGQRVIKLARDIFVVQILRNGIVDVKQRDRVTCDAGADELGQCAVDIDLTRDGNPAGCKTGVDVARLKKRLNC